MPNQPGDPMQVDVIIPSLTVKNPDMVRRCIQTMRASDPQHDFNVILVESGPGKIDCGQDTTTMFNRPVFNYNHALSLGIRFSDSSWVCLMNNDLIFHPFWFTEIETAWLTYPNIQSFSPWNNHAGYHDNVFSGAKRSIYPGFRVAYELCGWALICRRDVLETINLSDRVDLWFSDNIYSDELMKHGFIHALVPASRVDHICSQTIDFTKYDTGKDYVKYIGGNK